MSFIAGRQAALFTAVSVPQGHSLERTLVLLTLNVEWTPKGSVSAPLETWPDFRPKAIGTGKSPTIRITTCCKV